MSRKPGAYAVLAVACAALVGCSTSPSGTPSATTTETARPSVAVTVGPAPHQPARDGTEVKFDPCFDIGDAVVAQAGMDPTTRRRNDLVSEDYAFIGCEFDRIGNSAFSANVRVGGLELSSIDLPLDSFRQRADFVDKSDLTISGRPAFRYRLKASPDCSLAMNGPDGVINLSMYASAGATDWSACDHILDAATAIEAALPKANR